MDNIFEINKFDFDILRLNDPILINNNYFSKINYGKYNKNLYIKLDKCYSKNGINKTSNKCYCELNYIVNENNNILEFFENLEKNILDKVILNKEKWFYNSDNITNNDIEELLTPTCKPYKYGKNIIIKTNILNNKLLIYDEEENKLNLEDFKINYEFIPLIHINGIKFQNRSLILDIILKQILILPENNDLDIKCLLLNKSDKNDKSDKSDKSDIIGRKDLEKQELEEDLEKQELEEDLEKQELEEDLEEQELEEDLEEQDLEKQDLEEDVREEDLQEELKEEKLDKKGNLVNIDIIDLENIDNETFNIKTRDTIYLEMYQIAKKKAKEIRKNAIQAFIEAKNIKTQYNLDSLVNSDSSDEEF